MGQHGQTAFGPGQPTVGPEAGGKKKPGCFKIGCLGLVAIVLLGGVIGAISGAVSGNSPESGPQGPQSAVASSSQAQNAGSAPQSQAPQSSAPPAPESKPAESKPAEPQQPAAPGIGTPVKSGDLEFTITGHKCGVSVTEFGQKLEPQGQFCQASVTIKNVGRDQALVDEDMIKLLDAEGIEYSTSSDTLFVDGTIFLKQINPGISIKGIAYFDVPQSVAPVKATVRGGFLSGSEEILLK